ncbi:MAG: glycosyltransferase family 4 protein [Chromatiales bacterium]|nr:glycosyltransferase family 4 protein [Chromatiales bacterium]
MNILFVDSKSSENYDFKYMQSHSLGGTESTVLRVARELAQEHTIYISQINRTERYEESGITYIHNSEGLDQREIVPDIVIILRKYRLLREYSQAYPQAKMFVWVHNFQNHDILGRRHWIAKTNAQVICVSQCHQNHINRILNGGLSWLFRLLTLQFKKIPLTHIYNPIDNSFRRTEGRYDANKLFFFSTPNKGLKEVLNHFKALLKIAPDYRLYIAGSTEEQLKDYDLDREILLSKSVKLLGRLPKGEIIDHLRNSFCVFYPQHVHPETFGLIYIEANCVGTPVLAHSFGSTNEVIGNREQLIDATMSSAVVEKMLKWQQQGRPYVSCQKKFQLPNVIQKWKDTLGLD